MKVHPLFIDLPWFFHTPVPLLTAWIHISEQKRFMYLKSIQVWKTQALFCSQSHCVYAVTAVRMQGDKLCLLLPGLWACISIKHMRCYSRSFQTNATAFFGRAANWPDRQKGRNGDKMHYNISKPFENSPQGTPIWAKVGWIKLI